MKNHAGFTLIELMVTLAVVAILMYVSTSFTGLLKNNKISSSAQDFVAAVNLTRNEAITRTAQVTLCKSVPTNDAKDRVCIKDGSINNWDKGWIVFVDINNDQQFDNKNDNENLIRVYDALANNIILNGDSTSQDFLSFDSRGFRVKADGSVQIGFATFNLCDDRKTGNTAREITVNHIGQVSTKRDSADKCDT